MQKYRALKGKGLAFLLFIWFLWFVNFSGRTLFSPILPLMEDEFAITHAKAASIFTFITFGYALGLFCSGMISGRLGSKRTIFLALIVEACMFGLISTVATFNLLYVATFILSFALGLHLPTIIPMITEYYEEGVWGKVIAIQESATSLSIFAAPFLALAILSFLPWRGIFVVLAVVFLICAAAFQLLAAEVRTGEARPRFQPAILRTGSFWIMGTLWAFTSGSLMGLYYVLPLYLVKELSMSVQYGNSIFGFSRIGGVLVALVTGLYVDRVSLKKMLFWFAFGTGLLTMFLAVRSVPVIKVLLFVQASVATGLFPVALVAISRIFDRETRGQATGFVIMLGMAGSGVFPWLLGLSGDLVSFRLGIFLLGLCNTFASGLIFFLKGLR